MAYSDKDISDRSKDNEFDLSSRVNIPGNIYMRCAFQTKIAQCQQIPRINLKNKPVNGEAQLKLKKERQQAMKGEKYLERIINEKKV